MTYTGGIAPIVTVYGPGSLHHLAYASNSALGNVMGAVATTSTSTTNFALGFSYTYTGYAFYWDGPGDAFWRLGNSTLREPVGTSWANATGVPWGTEILLGVNVEAQAAKAAKGTAEVALIPDNLNLD
ncbi:hypothetical protein B0H13DRAFT_1884309 [Mycena leptocephala]|nr:hypothetical protein B0H13DRAFT_1884309 [Mycena leptocephala]